MNLRADGQEAFDVVAIGEILIEVATIVPFGQGIPARLGISGDALNVAAAAAAAGARVGLLAVLTDDELGQSIAAQVKALGISTELLHFRQGQQGIYLVHSDPSGQREFTYARHASVGSTLNPSDVDADVITNTGATIASGIACAISDSSKNAVLKAASLSPRFIYDPNFRPRLTGVEEATAVLETLAPQAFLVTPSYPGETAALMSCTTVEEAAHTLRRLGTKNVAVTCGADGVQLVSTTQSTWIDSVPAPVVVDQTGAGDAFVGSLAARVALGDSLEESTRYAVAAASLVVGGQGGTGFIPTLQQTRSHASGAAFEKDITIA